MHILVYSHLERYIRWPANFSKMPTCTMITREDNQTNHDDQLKRTKGKLPPVPDMGNSRLCRACQCRLPVSAFPLGYEEVFMQASYMGTDPAAQQAAGTGEEFTQEEAVDAVEEMLERRQEDVQTRGYFAAAAGY